MTTTKKNEKCFSNIRIDHVKWTWTTISSSFSFFLSRSIVNCQSSFISQLQCIFTTFLCFFFFASSSTKSKKVCGCVCARVDTDAQLKDEKKKESRCRVLLFLSASYFFCIFRNRWSFDYLIEYEYLHLSFDAIFIWTFIYSRRCIRLQSDPREFFLLYTKEQ